MFKVQKSAMSARTIGLAALPIALVGSDEYVTVIRTWSIEAVRAEALSLSDAEADAEVRRVDLGGRPGRAPEVVERAVRP